MAKQTFIEKTFKPEAQEWVNRIIAICTSYQRRGYRLSLRQVYYQLVAHHGLPNKETSYKNIGSLLNDARLAGLVDWNLIEDRNRETMENSHWTSPSHIVRACAEQFRINLWKEQPWHVEVMIEKSALEGVIQPVCSEWDVPFTSNKGYSSASAMYETGQRLRGAMRRGKKVAILYLGDHDPSGLDMTRDVTDRLALFSGAGYWVSDQIEMENNGVDKPCVVIARENRSSFIVNRLALNMDQIEQYGPPPNPAKLTDSRAVGYIAEHGDESWELDALDPEVLAELVESGIKEHLDTDLWNEANKEQKTHRRSIALVADKMDDDDWLTELIEEAGDDDTEEDEDAE